ncbi:hypothetical protein RhiirA5_423681 [Rhizophagus irregularis]|uniref:Uncharacterized protein n=1 Tax=Rhizophagus irregularis TaxID=588596 RepID=A0A2N0P9I0_9GLOM|nr:hypothetical protein RhiirA5_423681 [Rhizophagus irregularis]
MIKSSNNRDYALKEMIMIKLYKELNEDVRITEFLFWLNYLCTNKENCIWENLDKLNEKCNNIEKVTITETSIFEFNNNIEEKKQTLRNVEYEIMAIDKKSVLPNKKHVNIEINKKFIMEFEMSNRRKVDYKNYILKVFISNIIRKKLQFNFVHDEFEDVWEFNVKIEGMKKSTHLQR